MRLCRNFSYLWIMEREFLISGIYGDYGEDVFAYTFLYVGDFPAGRQAEEFMENKTFSKFRGITGIVEVFGDHGWD